MTTTTLSSKRGSHFGHIFRQVFKSQRGLFFYYAVLVFLFFPLAYTMSVMSPTVGESGRKYYSLFGASYLYSMPAAVIFILVMIVAPIILGLLQYHYMHSKKAVDTYHALPVSRQELMAANLAVGLCLLMAPVVISFAMIAVVQVITFGFSAAGMTVLLGDLATWAVLTAAVYTITVMVNTLVGTSFDALVQSLQVVYLPIIAILLTIFVFDSTLDGFSSDWIFQTPALAYFTPVSMIVVRLSLNYYAESFYEIIGGYHIALAIWAVIALLAAVAAVFFYRRRKSDLAEETSSRGWLKMATKLVFTYCASLVFGFIITLSFAGTASNALFIIGCGIGACLSYIIMEVILIRGFKGIGRSLPVMGGAAVFMMMFAFFCTHGGLGYETRLPEAGSIASVSIDYQTLGDHDILRDRPQDASHLANPIPGSNEFSNREDFLPSASSGEWLDLLKDVALTDPDCIELVRSLHENAIAALDHMDEEGPFYENFTITYHLTNGGTMTRSYSLCTQEMLEQLESLKFQPEYVQKTFAVFYTGQQQVKTLSYTDAFNLLRSEQFPEEWPRTALTQQQSDELLAAIQADLLARTPEQYDRPESRQVAMLSLELSEPEDSTQYHANPSAVVHTVLEGDANTIEVLRRLGLYEELTASPTQYADPAVSAKVGYYESGTLPYTSGNWNGNRYGWDSYIIHDMESSYMGDAAYVAEVTDPEQLEELIALARNTWGEGEDLAFVQLYTAGGVESGMLVIPRSQLPDSLQFTEYSAEDFVEPGTAYTRNGF